MNIKYSKSKKNNTKKSITCTVRQNYSLEGQESFPDVHVLSVIYCKTLNEKS